MTQLSRRSLITGLISLAAAPAIVRATSLMPVKVMEAAIIRNPDIWIMESTARGFRESPFYQLYECSKFVRSEFTVDGYDIFFDGGFTGI